MLQHFYKQALSQKIECSFTIALHAHTQLTRSRIHCHKGMKLQSTSIYRLMLSKSTLYHRSCRLLLAVVYNFMECESILVRFMKKKPYTLAYIFDLYLHSLHASSLLEVYIHVYILTTLPMIGAGNIDLCMQHHCECRYKRSQPKINA